MIRICGCLWASPFRCSAKPTVGQNSNWIFSFFQRTKVLTRLQNNTCLISHVSVAHTDTHGFRHSAAHSLSLSLCSAFQSNFHSWHRGSAYLPISVSLAEWVICKAMFTSTLRRFTQEWSLPGVLAVSLLAVRKLAEGKVIAVHSASWLSQPRVCFFFFFSKGKRISPLVLTLNNGSWHNFIKPLYVGASSNWCFSVQTVFFLKCWQTRMYRFWQSKCM